MANPLKMLDIKPRHFQFLMRLKVAAPPKRVWDTLADIGSWFRFSSAANRDPRKTPRLELWPGGRFYVEEDGGTASLYGTVTHVEPQKLLRLSGSMGLSHLPAVNAFIFQLEPSGESGTLLTFGQRTFGALTADVGKGYKSGWKSLFENLKSEAEKRARPKRSHRGTRSA